MTELAHVEEPCCEYARKRGFHVRKASWIGRRHAPDRLFFGHGVHFWIEFKAPGQALRGGQSREKDRMVAAGMIVETVDNYKDGVELIDRMYRLGKQRELR